jgi:hypothetical protein
MIKDILVYGTILILVISIIYCIRETYFLKTHDEVKNCPYTYVKSYNATYCDTNIILRAGCVADYYCPLVKK